ncbi:helix-turn-helix domain-containing protein [Pseudomonas sp. MDMC_285]|nr:helix-turn-helix domain-containing protein [Pseudomonas sp. MDMC_285]
MTTYERLVAHFKSQENTATALGVKQGTVSGWITGKHGMSAVTALRAERVTGGAFKAHELCPALLAVA